MFEFKIPYSYTKDRPTALVEIAFKEEIIREFDINSEDPVGNAKSREKIKDLIRKDFESVEEYIIHCYDDQTGVDNKEEFKSLIINDKITTF